MKRGLLIVLVILFAFLISGGIFLSVRNANTSDRMVPPTEPTVTTPVSISTAPVSTKMSVKGKVLCLPHKNTSGPQTMECAYGLQGIDGKYYALSDTDPTYANLSKLPMNENVVISGTFTPKENDKYPTVGILTIESVQQ